TLTPAAKDLLAEKGYDPVLGARPLRRTIQRDIEDMLSERILFGQIQVGDEIVVDAHGEGLLGELTFAHPAAGGELPGHSDEIAVDAHGEGLLGELTFAHRAEGGELTEISDEIDVESMTQARAEDLTRADGVDSPDTDSAEANAS